MRIEKLISEAIAKKPATKRVSANLGQLDLSKVIRMGLNEHPYGMSPKALEVIQTKAYQANLYGDFQAKALKEELAVFYELDFDNILTANGSSACIEIMGRAFLNPGDEVLMCPTFAAFIDMTQVHQAVPVIVPLKEDLTYDLEGLLDAITEKTKMIVICNPNNPTGTYVGWQEIEKFMEQVPEDIIVVFDEAYLEFATAPDCVTMVRLLKEKPDKPIIILKTFSKYYAMAGIRAGYAIAPKELIDVMKKCPCSCNMNTLSQQATIAALHDQEYYQEVKQKVVKGREYIEKNLKSLGCKVFPSQTNFVYFDAGIAPVALFQLFLEKGMMISANQYSRVSIGVKEHNELFIQYLEEILSNQECKLG